MCADKHFYGFADSKLDADKHAHSHGQRDADRVAESGPSITADENGNDHVAGNRDAIASCLPAPGFEGWGILSAKSGVVVGRDT